MSLNPIHSRSYDDDEVVASPPRGSQHLFGAPLAHQRFQVFGAEPAQNAQAAERTRVLMRKLSLRVEAAIDWAEPRSPALKAWENPGLPSGYAYLFQFVGHDLANTAVPFSTAAAPQTMSGNLRSAALQLQTLYGDGPVATRFAYEPARGEGEERVRLRLGRIRRDDRTQDAQCPHRDIPRGPAECPAFQGGELSEPLIADTRNDAHAILSQLTVLFSLLHNGVVDLLDAATPPAHPGAARAHAMFASARHLTAQVFRRVVHNDLLRRLLDPRIYAAYDGGVRLTDGLSSEGGWKVPLEFSQGAIRFGHSLVRDEYRVNDGAVFELLESLTKTSLADPRNMPLNESWMVQWSHFFPLDGAKPNLAKRIGPNYSSGLLSAKIFPPIDSGGRYGLAYRDLLSSAFSNIWSVRAMIEEIRARRPDFVRRTRLLDDHAWRASEISAWLRERRLFGGMDAEEVAAIANDPPLSFYVQWEAMHEADGLHLGPLGSIIIAETLFAALSSPLERPFGFVGGAPAAACAKSVQDKLDCLSQVTTMPELILFVRDASALARTSPAFV